MLSISTIYSKYTEVVTEMSQTNRVFLLLFSVVVFARHLWHAWVPDGGLGRANQPMCAESLDVVTTILFMYGNTQLGMFIHDVLALVRNERVLDAIHVHGFLAVLHVFVVYVLWDHIKPMPYPALPTEGLRPGGYLWYIEVGLYVVFLITQFLSGTNKKSKD